MLQLIGIARKFWVLCITVAVVVTAVSWSVAAADRTPRVYLFRGFMNIFSTGMDEVAAALRKRGVKATSLNHLETSSVAAQLVEDYKKGKRGPIVLIGHSLGATAVVDMSNQLGASGVPVALVVSLDPISSITATGRVRRLINLYLPAGSGVAVSRGRTFRGTLQNINVGKTDVGHVSIAQSGKIHNMLIGYVMSTIGRSHRSASRPAARTKKQTPSEEPATPAEKKEDEPSGKPTAASASKTAKSGDRRADKPETANASVDKQDQSAGKPAREAAIKKQEAATKPAADSKPQVRPASKKPVGKQGVAARSKSQFQE